MNKGGLSLEIKVGAFLITSVAVLVAFIFVLGNFRFRDGHKLAVELPASGGLRVGAKVKVAGVNAGKVREIAFLGGQLKDPEGRPMYVRLSVEIDQEMASAVTQGSVFAVTTEGILGERYVEISPGPPDAPQIADGSVVYGRHPVQLQEIASQAAQLMSELKTEFQGEGEKLSTLVDSTRETVESTKRLAASLEKRLPEVVDQGGELMRKANDSLERIDALTLSANDLLADLEGVKGVVDHALEVARKVDEGIMPLLDSASLFIEDGRSLVDLSGRTVESVRSELTATTSRAREFLGRMERVVDGKQIEALVVELRQLTATAGKRMDDVAKVVEEIAGQAKGVLTDAAAVGGRIRKGKGTLGALIMDRELYDDLRELVLDLKRNPWKAVRKP